MLFDEVSIGFYHCVICDTKLFSFNHKFDSKTGHASFYQSAENRVEIVEDEVRFEGDDLTRPMDRVNHSPSYKRCQCNICKTHLGAVFFDGPPPTFVRFSINSALLRFEDMRDFPDPNIERRRLR